MSNTIPASYASLQATANSSSRVPAQTLGQEDFLKLLVAKMSHQDPLNPQEDTEFISQMAQFSSLEQTKDMYQSMQVLQANSLLGRTVEVEAETEDVTGTVSAVIVEAGKPKVIVGGTEYDLNRIRLITPEDSSTPKQSV